MCCLFRSSIHESTRRPSSSVKKGSVEITATQGVVWGSGQHQQRTMEGGATTTHSPLGVCLLTTHSASIAGGCSFIFLCFVTSQYSGFNFGLSEVRREAFHFARSFSVSWLQYSATRDMTPFLPLKRRSAIPVKSVISISGAKLETSRIYPCFSIPKSNKGRCHIR